MANYGYLKGVKKGEFTEPGNLLLESKYTVPLLWYAGFKLEDLKICALETEQEDEDFYEDEDDDENPSSIEVPYLVAPVSKVLDTLHSRREYFREYLGEQFELLDQFCAFLKLVEDENLLFDPSDLITMSATGEFEQELRTVLRLIDDGASLNSIDTVITIKRFESEGKQDRFLFVGWAAGTFLTPWESPEEFAEFCAKREALEGIKRIERIFPPGDGPESRMFLNSMNANYFPSVEYDWVAPAGVEKEQLPNLLTAGWGVQKRERLSQGPAVIVESVIETTEGIVVTLSRVNDDNLAVWKQAVEVLGAYAERRQYYSKK